MIKQQHLKKKFCDKTFNQHKIFKNVGIYRSRLSNSQLSIIKHEIEFFQDALKSFKLNVAT